MELIVCLSAGPSTRVGSVLRLENFRFPTCFLRTDEFSAGKCGVKYLKKPVFLPDNRLRCFELLFQSQP
jgi:hypothetical protein